MPGGRTTTPQSPKASWRVCTRASSSSRCSMVQASTGASCSASSRSARSRVRGCGARGSSRRRRSSRLPSSIAARQSRGAMCLKGHVSPRGQRPGRPVHQKRHGSDALRSPLRSSWWLAVLRCRRGSNGGYGACGVRLRLLGAAPMGALAGFCPWRGMAAVPVCLASTPAPVAVGRSEKGLVLAGLQGPRGLFVPNTYVVQTCFVGKYQMQWSNVAPHLGMP